MVEDTPDDLVMELFSGAFWPDHPLGRPILGTKRSVSSFRRDDLATFFADVYHAGNILIAAAGNLSHKATARLVQRHFGALAGRPAKPPRVDTPKAAIKVVTRAKKELEQVHLCLGAPAYPQAHAERFPAYVLNTVLGGSMSSRLFQNVREKRGLVYSISSGVSAYSDAGAFTIYAGTSLDSVDEVVRLSLEELRRARNEPLPDPELRRAKDHLKGSLMLSLESTGSRMNHIARQEIYFGRQFGQDEIMAGIEAVSAGDVTRIASRLFDGPLHASVLGNLKGYRPKTAQLRL
jgi:predicted Zn-dependent peptidase